MGILSMIRGTLAPAAYHGRGKQGFFEGWYFKLMDRDQRHCYTLIPGIYQAREQGKSHAFIQVMDGRSGQSSYHSYPAAAFEASEQALDVHIGPNSFSPQGLALNIQGEQGGVQGQLSFGKLTPWPVTLSSPGIMGWYAWVPLMECYHGVVSLDHTLSGSLRINGQEIDFSGGRGYIEKDWGRSFPKAWIWFQTNAFSLPGDCLTASIAIIPWVRQAFNGFIVGYWHDRKLYRFATYTGARTEHLTITAEYAAWVVRDRRYRLEMIARRAEGGILRAPTTIEMDRRIAETLNASVEVRLFAFEGERVRLLHQDLGTSAGLEAVGEMSALAAY